MKKLIALLSISAFLVFNASACDPAAKASKDGNKATTTSVSKDAKSSSAACCTKANAACCKNDKSAAKNCTPEQKAACAKAGKASLTEVKEEKTDKAKAEVKAQAPATMELDNSGIQ